MVICTCSYFICMYVHACAHYIYVRSTYLNNFITLIVNALEKCWLLIEAEGSKLMFCHLKSGIMKLYIRKYAIKSRRMEKGSDYQGAYTYVTMHITSNLKLQCLNNKKHINSDLKSLL